MKPTDLTYEDIQNLYWLWNSYLELQAEKQEGVMDFDEWVHQHVTEFQQLHQEQPQQRL